MNDTQSAARASRPGEYEFNKDENAVFDHLAAAMRGSGLAWIALGLACVGALVVAGFAMERRHTSPALLIGNGIAVALIFVMAGSSLSAARTIARIVSTRGSDITLLMDAMKQTVQIYNVQRTVVVVATVLVFLSLALEKLEHLF